MQIRCPHCQIAIEVVDDTELSEISCPSCGSSFSLLGEEATRAHERSEPRTIGHFELIDEVGVGHYGSVWMARDTQLDRTVALKIPRKGRLEGTDAALFLREAQAAAQLRHPGIVTVHEVGRHDETLYIVSDFIRGVTLADATSARRFAIREAAELCAKIAAALHHAHEVGVVHRDLKPGNIMLDSEGEPHVTDFGLAKREAAEITMTVEGKVLGTPAYMSPEQARGEGHLADRRCDIYSLGVIFYQLLTGELPFRGTPRMLMHQLLNEEPVAPRSLNDRIPRDAETICTKAMAKEPARRYRTAAEMVADLQRYLDGEPIHARPVSRAERVWRWCRRNPRTAVLAASLAAALVVGLSGITWQWRRAEQNRRAAETNLAEAVRQRGHAETNAAEAQRQRDLAEENAREAQRNALEADKQRESAERNLAEAQRQRGRAEENFDKARSAVDDFLTEISQNALLNVPSLQPLRKDLLELAVEYYRGFIIERGDDPETQQQTSYTYHRLASITAGLGSLEEARKLVETAIEIQEELAFDPDHLTHADHRELLATEYSTLGSIHTSAGRANQAAAAYEKAIEIREKLIQENPRATHYRNRLGDDYGTLAIVLMNSDILDRAVTAVDKSVEIQQGVVRQNPLNRDYRQYLARAYQNAGAVRSRLSQRDETTRYYQLSVDILERLVSEDPTKLFYKIDLANAYGHLGESSHILGRSQEAAEAYRRGIQLWEQLVRENPAVPNYRRLLGLTYGRAGAFYASQGDLGNAARLERLATETLTELAEDFPGLAQAKAQLANHFLGLATTQRSAGQMDSAARLFERAAGMYEQLVEENLQSGQFRRVLAETYYWLGFSQADAGLHDDASNAYEKAIEHGEAYVRDNPNNTEAKLTLARSYGGLATEQLDMQVGDPAAVVPLAQKAVEGDNPVSTWQTTLGGAHYRGGNYQVALKSLNTAMIFLSVGRRQRIGRDSFYPRGTARAAAYKAMTHFRLGQTDDARKTLALAKTALDEFHGMENVIQSDKLYVQQIVEPLVAKADTLVNGDQQTAEAM